MTIIRVGPGVRELRGHHGDIYGRGDLYTMVTLWVRLKREGWPDVPYGQPAIDPVTGSRTIECTCCRDCQCRACTSPPILSRPRTRARG